MTENLIEIIFYDLEWGDDETRQRKLAPQTVEDGLEYVRHQPIPNIHGTRVFFRRVEELTIRRERWHEQGARTEAY